MYYNYDDEEYDSEYDCYCYENDRDDCEKVMKAKSPTLKAFKKPKGPGKRKPIKNAIKSVIAFGTKFGTGKRSVFTLLLRIRKSGFELLYHTPYGFVKRKM